MLRFVPTICRAKRFVHETKGFCYVDGTISFVENEVPIELYHLYMPMIVENMKFLMYVHTYNNIFVFTSFEVKFDRALYKRNRKIYMFRAQGQIYHYNGNLVPLNGYPSYLQLYF